MTTTDGSVLPAAVPGLDVERLLAAVRTGLLESAPPAWPELTRVVLDLAQQPRGPLAVLPLASCAAAGGDPRRAVPVGTAWEILNLAMRLLDDLEDQDRPEGLWNQIGVSRTFNLSAALYVLACDVLTRADWPPTTYRPVMLAFHALSLRVAAGQDRDLQESARTVDELWSIVEDKNGAAFELACRAGALAGDGEPAAVEACAAFGRHVGNIAQIFDDLEGVWGEDAVDLVAGRRTLPCAYALSVDHPGRDTLSALLDEGEPWQVDGIRLLLDQARTRDSLGWLALEERARAAAALETLHPSAGRALLQRYLAALFVDLDAVVRGPAEDAPRAEAAADQS